MFFRQSGQAEWCCLFQLGIGGIDNMIFKTQQKNRLMGDWHVGMSEYPTESRGSEVAPGRWWSNVFAGVFFVATVAVAVGLAILATPEAASAQEDGEPSEPALAYTIETLAGNSYVRDGGPATRAWLEFPRAVAVDAIGNLYIAEWGHHRIRKVDATTGRISTIAGTGEPGYSGDGGQAGEARIGFPSGVAVDGSGNVYFPAGTRVRKVDAITGMISAIAGTGESGYSGDGGPATEARLFAGAVAVDGSGNLYIVGRGRIRKVDGATGTISTIAGTGESGYSGDGGPATEAQLGEVRGVAVDAAGNVYIADYGNDRVRKVDGARGTISTIAGTGESGYSGDGGPATEAELRRLEGVAVDGAGNVYIADWYRIRKVDGARGTISTIAGTRERGISGDGGGSHRGPTWRGRGRGGGRCW